MLGCDPLIYIHKTTLRATGVEKLPYLAEQVIECCFILVGKFCKLFSNIGKVQ